MTQSSICTSPRNQWPLSESPEVRRTAAETSRGNARKILSCACGLFGLLVLAGCSSSGSSGFQADARFATAGEESFATTVETMGEGDELRLPMGQERYEVDGPDHEVMQSRQNATFTLTMEENGHAVTIETPDDSFTWEPGSVDVGGGFLLASDVRGDVAMTEAEIYSRYFEYVHFGLWEVSSHDEEFVHTHTDGGVFRQGFETERENMPTTGSATYEGGMIGKVFSGGETGVEFDGIFTLHADFGDGRVEGMLDSLGQFNNIELSGASIRNGNAFSGTAVTEASTAAKAFAEGTEGRYEGAFFGPSAEEAGGSWRVEEGVDVAIGAFGGPKQ